MGILQVCTPKIMFSQKLLKEYIYIVLYEYNNIKQRIQ